MKKAVGYEHIKVGDSGDLEGLWLIDGHKVREHFGDRKYWQGVDEIIRRYTEINPLEMATAKAENDAVKKENRNSFGSNNSGSFRHALNLPYGLLLVLKDFDKDIIQDKKKRQSLMKLYPNLCACEIV